MRLLYGYDENGYFNSDIYPENYEPKKPGNYTSVTIDKNYYKPRFTGNKWEEGATANEIKKFKEQAEELKVKTESECLEGRVEKLENFMFRFARENGIKF